MDIIVNPKIKLTYFSSENGFTWEKHRIVIQDKLWQNKACLENTDECSFIEERGTVEGTVLSNKSIGVKLGVSHQDCSLTQL